MPTLRRSLRPWGRRADRLAQAVVVAVPDGRTLTVLLDRHSDDAPPVLRIGPPSHARPLPFRPGSGPDARWEAVVDLPTTLPAVPGAWPVLVEQEGAVLPLECGRLPERQVGRSVDSSSDVVYRLEAAPGAGVVLRAVPAPGTTWVQDVVHGPGLLSVEFAVRGAQETEELPLRMQSRQHPAVVETSARRAGAGWRFVVPLHDLAASARAGSFVHWTTHVALSAGPQLLGRRHADIDMHHAVKYALLPAALPGTSTVGVRPSYSATGALLVSVKRLGAADASR